MSKKLHVGNLAFDTTADDLQNAFAQHGAVDSVNLVTDRQTGNLRGFGFVEMSSGAEAAIEALNGSELRGRTITVEVAHPRAERRPAPSSSYSGGYGGGRRY